MRSAEGKPVHLTRVGELLNGKIVNRSVDKLPSCAGRLGIEATTKFAGDAQEAPEKELSLTG